MSSGARMVFILAILQYFLQSPLGTAANPHRGYVFTAPKRLIAGETESGCLSIHHLSTPAHALLELLTTDDVAEEEILAASSFTLETGVEACLELLVPHTKYSVARLRLKVRFDKHPDYTINSEKDVYIEHDSHVTFVETDKPVYKPGQDVNIRILTVKHDLKPWKKPIPKIWIESPSEVRVAQWLNVSTDLGLVQLTFPLSPEPSPGIWKIKVEKKKFHLPIIDTKTFEVKKYVLPRFQVSITPPGYILANAENVTWNVCAKYSYGKPVKGSLHLKSTPQTPTWRRKQNLPEINYLTELNSEDGCVEFTVTGSELGLADWKVLPNNIMLTANFTEAGTGVVETATSRTNVVHQSLKLEFLPHTPQYFKLGLPYHGKLRVLKQDNTPAPNEKIQLCLKVRGKDDWLRVVVECRNFTSSSDGFIDFIVPPQHKNIESLSFVAAGVEYPTKYYSPDKRWRVFMDQPSAYMDTSPWYSPSDSYLSVAPGYQPIVCGEKYSFNVMYTMPINHETNEPISFHYSVNSKGDLLIFGHVKHKPHKDSVLNYSEFRNLLGAVETPANRTDQTHVVHRFPLSVKVTPSMAPVSELLLYYVRPDGETVATTYTIVVGNCFGNKVKTAWHEESQSPGGKTQFHIEAAPFSLCGISALDKSTMFLRGGKTNMMSKDDAFNQLKRFHIKPTDSPIQSRFNYCLKVKKQSQEEVEVDHLPRPAEEEPPFYDLRRRKRSMYYGRAHYIDAMQAFDDFGVIVMSDLTLETRPCSQISGVYFSTQRTAMTLEQTDTGLDGGPLFIRHRAMPLAYPLLTFDAQLNHDYLDPTDTADTATTIRSYFPETWLWELVQTGKEGTVTIERQLPHTITDWVGYTTCISPRHGLGIAPPTTITAFQSFFLDYTLPYSVKRGEMLHMKVSLFNYMQHSLPVKIKLEDARGLDLHLSRSVVSFCVDSRSSVVHEYILRPRVLGDVNITVSAAVDAEYPDPCGPDTLIHTRDVITKPILVLPEGFPVEVTKSAFICPKDFVDDSFVVWNLDLPEDLVAESARAYVSLIGDILGPALENLEKLVRLPMGCGEQNMVLFVPNIHVINYLEATHMENSALKAKAIKNMEKGYQRELNYRHPDGSYSAFGADNLSTEGSMWLTAFVVKSLAQAQHLIHVDERDLKFSVKWITKRQLENGCFPVRGQVFHKDMKGGLQDDNGSSLALTAYVLISLLESGVPLQPALTNNALHCLEKDSVSGDGNPYTLALTTYALTLLEHPRANDSLQALIGLATKHQDLIWWENKTKPSVGLSVEMTAYAILSLVKIGGETNMVTALRAVRWISKQRNAEGGFTSTQDTVLGLEALTKYASAMSLANTDLSVLITANEIDHAFKMQNENRLLFRQVQLPVLPTTVEIFADGEGCVLVQSNLKYNVPHATGSDAFDLSVNAESVASVDECAMQRITVCARYKMADEESNMALIDIGMISGYIPDRSSLHSLLENPSTYVKRFEEDRDVVSIYLEKLTTQRTCISFIVTRENVVDRPEAANVKLYDYYQQELTVSSSYNFAPTCSSSGVNEGPGIPNPMPNEPNVRNTTTRGNSPTTTSTARSTTDRDINVVLLPVEAHSDVAEGPAVLRHAKNMRSDSKLPENVVAALPLVTDKPELKTVPPAKITELIEKFKEKIAARNMEIKAKVNGTLMTTGIEPKLENVSLVENSDIKMNSDGLEETGHVRTENDNSVREFKQAYKKDNDEIFKHIDVMQDMGSGEAPNEREFGLNPAFVEVDHDLELPDGIEGPEPVFVKPDKVVTFDGEDRGEDASVTNDDIQNPEQTKPTYEKVSHGQDVETTRTIGENLEDGMIVEPEQFMIEQESLPSTPSSLKTSCPTCLGNIPKNISEIYCKAKSVVKVAIRRFHKARLLLDLHASRSTSRLRSTIDLTIDPDCSCEIIDTSGGFALLIDQKDSTLASLVDHVEQHLGKSVTIYKLPNTQGLPPEIKQARALC
ncbi:pregnancy zone protein-like isoform X1 [Athalia rosae]|uniref:pregnancy zone protein-like isoform X1 n=1 Tax=Athalia rosae TaxID=37344 RepID=UPI0020336267|nr:pregnancy zone protein-like isoform X1 [Athalia rosae]